MDSTGALGKSAERCILEPPGPLKSGHRLDSGRCLDRRWIRGRAPPEEIWRCSLTASESPADRCLGCVAARPAGLDRGVEMPAELSVHLADLDDRIPNSGGNRLPGTLVLARHLALSAGARGRCSDFAGQGFALTAKHLEAAVILVALRFLDIAVQRHQPASDFPPSFRVEHGL